MDVVATLTFEYKNSPARTFSAEQFNDWGRHMHVRGAHNDERAIRITCDDWSKLDDFALDLLITRMVGYKNDENTDIIYDVMQRRWEWLNALKNSAQ